MTYNKNFNHITRKWRMLRGFTLAEVLITLGIIGIVAAMTLPGLLAKHRERQRVVQLKKAYSILQQAFLMVRAEYGEIEYWDYTSSSTGEKDEEGNTIVDSTGYALFITRLKKYIKQSGTRRDPIEQYLSLDGREWSSSLKLEENNSIFLADGTIVYVGWVYEDCSNAYVECGDIMVVLPEKTVQTGISSFWFYITPTGIKPYGHPDFHYGFEDYCDKTNSGGKASNQQGRSCTAWVLYNENMDYLKCSDLSWDGKQTCK